jgi:RNase P subunit RPR2
MAKEEKAIKPRFCHECSEKLCGTPGKDWHYVKRGGKTTYYCAKCAAKIMRGE